MGDSALLNASLGVHREVMQELLTRNVDINIQNKDGYTALMLAILRFHMDCVQVRCFYER